MSDDTGGEHQPRTGTHEPAPRPPALARRLLERLLPTPVRRSALADLDEEYRRDRRVVGPLRARLRYWRELASPWIWSLRRESRRPRTCHPRPSGDASVSILWNELRQSVRSLRRSPGLALVAVLTLALGIGVNAAVFTVVDGVLLEPLPYEDSDRIAVVWGDLGDGAQSLPAVHGLDVQDYREWSDAFDSFTQATGREVVVGDDVDPELLDLGRVEAGFFSFFGVEPLLGRGFEVHEDVPGGPAVTVLSHRLWQRRYGGDPRVLGRTIRINRVPHQVVGVLPPGFRLHLPAEAFLLRDADLWRPAQIDPAQMPPRNFTGYTVFGRLAPGATWERTGEDMRRISERLRERYPVHATANTRVRAVPLHRDVTKGVSPALRVLLAAVGLVLLLACANVAHLLLARGRSRERELAVRAALGAGQRRLASSLLLESLVLALAGGVAGLAVAAFGLELLDWLRPGDLPRLGEVAIDGTILAVTGVACLGTALVFGLIPALQGTPTDLASTLREGGRTGTEARHARTRSLLVIGQVALSLTLLVGAGLMVRSFIALQDVDPGYDADGLLTFRLRLPPVDEYASGRQRAVFFDSLRAELERLPGVESVSAVSQLPLTGSGPLQPFAYDEETARNWESVTADSRAVLPGFFDTMGATVVAGRGFTTADDGSTGVVIVVDERLARMAFPDGDAVGERLQVAPQGDEDSFAEIVGVVRHLQLHDLGRDQLPQIYLPYAQLGWTELAFVLRTDTDPAALAAPAREVVRGLDPGLPVSDLRTMRELLSATLSQARFSLVLMACFAGLALALVSVGVYGVVSYDVGQRTRELGIRMALGGSPAGIRARVLGRGLRLAAASLVTGLAGAMLLSRFLSSLLYGVDPLDPTTYLAVSLLVTAVTLLACWIPARRATRIDPVDTLRTE